MSEVNRAARIVLVPSIATVLFAFGCATAPRRAPERPPELPPEPRVEPEPKPEVPAPRPRRTRARIEALPFPSALPIPVDGVSGAELASSFDAPRSGGRRHRAIDIFAPRNTPVRATTPGYVSSRGIRSLGGRTISVVGPGGFRHYYAHLEAWAGFDRGDFVEPGDVLGYVGNSGNASGGPTHLHYAIYGRNDAPLDPFVLLRRGPGPFD